MAKKKRATHRKANKGAIRKAAIGKTSKKKRTSVKKTSKNKSKKSVASKAGNGKNGPRAWIADYPRAKRAFLRHRDEIKKLPGVTGLSVGCRYKKGKAKREMTLRLHVRTEEAKRYLKENADQLGFKKYYGGIGTDIIVWSFRTASSGSTLPDGTCIKGSEVQGTLGTTVIKRLNGGPPKAVWLTAAHVASHTRPLAGSTVDIHQCGGGPPIGTVSSSEYFRDDIVDAAIIDPANTLSLSLPARAIRRLNRTHMGADVTMLGAVTQQAQGKIDSVLFEDVLVDTGEPVVDHFSVIPQPNVPFAKDGDSGAIVFLGNQLVGMLRAVFPDTGVGVVSKLFNVRAAGGFSL